MTEKKEQKKEHISSPYDFFRSTAHELITQDAAFQLIKSGETIREILMKTTLPDQEFLNRGVQCVAKLEDSDLGEDSEPPYDSGINLVKNLLNGLNSIQGRSRGEFIQGIGRLFAPSYFELMRTGKMSPDGKVKKKFGVFKGKEEKDENEGI